MIHVTSTLIHETFTLEHPSSWARKAKADASGTAADIKAAADAKAKAEQSAAAAKAATDKVAADQKPKADEKTSAASSVPEPLSLVAAAMVVAGYHFWR